MGDRAAALRGALNSGKIVIAPGVTDALTARIAARYGFGALFMTGAGVAASLGLLDGLATLTEVAERAEIISRAVATPLIVDGESGFGDHEHICRMVEEFERANVGGFFFEDQRPGVLKVAHVFVGQGADAVKGYAHAGADAFLFTPAEMSERIRTAAKTRKDPNTVVIARTDVMLIEGLESAIDRANAYAEAGADLVFVQQPRTLADVEALLRGMKVGLLINTTSLNATGVTTEQLEKAGVKVVLYSNAALRIAWKKMDEAFAYLAKHGTYGELVKSMMPMSEYLSFVDPK